MEDTAISMPVKDGKLAFFIVWTVGKEVCETVRKNQSFELESSGCLSIILGDYLLL